MRSTILARARTVFGRIFRVLRVTGSATNTTIIVIQRIVALTAIAALATLLLWPAPSLPHNFDLSIDLTLPVKDVSPAADSLTGLLGQSPSLAMIVHKIATAAEDPRVHAIQITIGPACCSLIAAEEISAALRSYRHTTNRTVEVFAYGFGEGTGSVSEYLIAIAATHIALLDSGSFGASGIHLEMPFLRAALDRLGVSADFARQGRYKAYPETFERNDPSPDHQQMLDSLADSLYETVTAAIATSRHLSEAAVRDAFAHAPLTARQALDRNLIDAVALDPPQQDDQRPTVTLANYERAPGPTEGKPAKMALITAVGTIGEPTADTANTSSINPTRLAKLLRDTAKQPGIAAIILRVDSPGGSVTGSAMIDAEIRRIVRKTPVVVSMGNYAASGGYWISSHASRIIADPETLTGSIGVFAGKLEFAGVATNLGVHFHTVDRGSTTSMWSSIQPLTTEQKDRLEDHIGDVYGMFLDTVADGRKLPRERVDAIAQGRVWTGAQALDLHLVDSLGGYEVAFDAARQLAGLPDDAPITIIYPRAGSLLSELRSYFSVAQASLAPSLGSIQGTADIIALLQSLNIAGAVQMSPINIR